MDESIVRHHLVARLGDGGRCAPPRCEHRGRLRVRASRRCVSSSGTRSQAASVGGPGCRQSRQPGTRAFRRRTSEHEARGPHVKAGTESPCPLQLRWPCGPSRDSGRWTGNPACGSSPPVAQPLVQPPTFGRSDRRFASDGTSTAREPSSLPPCCHVGVLVLPRWARGMTSKRSTLGVRAHLHGTSVNTSNRSTSRVVRCLQLRSRALGVAGQGSLCHSQVLIVLRSNVVSEDPCPSASVVRTRAALPWGLVPYDALRSGQRLAPGLPHPAMRRLQVFSTS
jgi:hypothetical protein